MSNWAAGWILSKGRKIEFDDKFLDVAVKLHSVFESSLRKTEKGFILEIEEVPKNFSIDINFLRGVFESSGTWGNRAIFIPKINEVEKELLSLLSEFSPLETEDGFFITGESANLLIHLFYDEETEERSEYFFERFLTFLTGENWERTSFKFSLEEGALPPFKKRISDSGFDLYLIKLLKVEGNVYFFDTGVRVSPPPGYYFDLVPRSSIYKSGFILANSVGIIDMTYRGTIKVPLIKVNQEKELPELPWRAVQLIPRRFFPLEAEEVESLEKTLRGEGGFGSTG
jgi:dUTP pyrophosphatase